MMPAVTTLHSPMLTDPDSIAAAMPSSEAVALPDAVVLATRLVAVASLLALIALDLAWELWLAPTGQRTLVVKVLPLLIPLPGLLKLRLYTYRWVSLLVWLYFIEGIVRATSGTGLGAALAWGQTLLCLGLFVACLLQVRRRLRPRSAPAGDSAA
jgi:uncharacterized membrane protein